MAKEYESPKIEISDKPIEIDAGDSARYKLPYGIARGYGLNTDGKTPHEVWEMLKGKGVNPDNEYKKLKEKAQETEKKGEVAQKPIRLESIEDIASWSKMTGIEVDIDALFNGSISQKTAIEQINKIQELYELFPIKGNNAFRIGAFNGQLRAIAKTEYYVNDEKISIDFNTSYFEDNAKIEESVRTNVIMGEFSDCAEENFKFYPVLHEYGHAIVDKYLSDNGYGKKCIEVWNRLIQKANINLDDEYKRETNYLKNEMFYNKIMPKIFEKAKEFEGSIKIPTTITEDGYKTAPYVSGYAESKSWGEYFAESFANGMSGASDAIGKATVEIVKEIYGGKYNAFNVSLFEK